MAILDTTRFVERPQFFTGQRLLASDLQDLEGVHREMRELHNRSLHQPGIGNGFAVTGVAGDREVTVGPGYALDADGHEIVLTRAHREPVPPVAGGDDGQPALFHLTVAYPESDDLEESETRRGVCSSHGTVRLREEPGFCWVRLRRELNGRLRPVDRALQGEINAGRRVVLARVEVEQCRLKSAPVLGQRRDARPPTQPRVVCGRESEPQWTLRDLGAASGPMRYILKGQLRTKSGDFAATPSYFARVDGPRRLTALLNAGTGDEHEEPFFADGILSVLEGSARPRGFEVEVLLAIAGNLDLLAEAELDGDTFEPWAIEWMGIE